MWVRCSWTVVVSVNLLVLVGGVRAQEAPQKAPAKEYARSEAMVPMRDGVKLHVVILRPAGSESAGEPLPFLMERTPYGTDNYSSKSVNIAKPELAANFIGGFKGASSERQPPMYFRLGGGTLKGISKPGHIVWSRIFVMDNELHCDLGIAKVVQSAAEHGSFTKTGGKVTSFTPAYGAPEQFSRAQGATGPWTDVYALALVMVELLIGRPPLEGDDFIQLGMATADPSRRPTPGSFGITTHRALESVFLKALAVKPPDRYPTAGEFWQAVRHSQNMPGMQHMHHGS